MNVLWDNDSIFKFFGIENDGFPWTDKMPVSSLFLNIYIYAITILYKKGCQIIPLIA